MGTIFKYYAINGKNLDALENKYFWFSKPPRLNDPIDCNMAILKNNPETVKVLEDRYGQDIIEILKQRTNDFGVCCFSEVLDSLQLWNDYAIDHTGFVIAFDEDILSEYYSELYKCKCSLLAVEYWKNPFDLKGLPSATDVDTIFKPIKSIILDEKDTDAFFEKLLIQKEECRWGTEKEKRLILGGLALQNGAKKFIGNPEVGYKIPMPDNVIKGFYFGSNMQKADIEHLVKIAQRNYNCTKFYREVSGQNSTEIKFEPYT